MPHRHPNRAVVRTLKTVLAPFAAFLTVALLGAGSASAQVQFLAGSSGARPIRVEGLTEATGTIAFSAMSSGTIVASSTITLDYGTAILDCSGAVAFNGGPTSGFLTKSCSGNVVTLSFFSNQAFVVGHSLTVSGVRVNANALGSGANVTVTVGATVPPASQATNPISLIQFSALTVATVQASPSTTTTFTQATILICTPASGAVVFSVTETFAAVFTTAAEETGLGPAGTGGSVVATRVQLSFTNIPVGVRLDSVTTRPEHSGTLTFTVVGLPFTSWVGDRDNDVDLTFTATNTVAVETLAINLNYSIPDAGALTAVDQTGSVTVWLRGAADLPNAPVFAPNAQAGGNVILAHSCDPPNFQVSSVTRSVRPEGTTEVAGSLLFTADASADIVPTSTITLTYGAAVEPTSGTVTTNCTGGSISKSISGTTVTLTFTTANLHCDIGQTISVSGVRVNANASGAGTVILVSFVASVPDAFAATNPIRFNPAPGTQVSVASVQPKAATVSLNAGVIQTCNPLLTAGAGLKVKFTVTEDFNQAFLGMADEQALNNNGNVTDFKIRFAFTNVPAGVRIESVDFTGTDGTLTGLAQAGLPFTSQSGSRDVNVDITIGGTSTTGAAEKLDAEFLFWTPDPAALTTPNEIGVVAVQLRGGTAAPEVPRFVDNTQGSGNAILVQDCIGTIYLCSPPLTISGGVKRKFTVQENFTMAFLSSADEAALGPAGTGGGFSSFKIRFSFTGIPVGVQIESVDFAGSDGTLTGLTPVGLPFNSTVADRDHDVDVIIGGTSPVGIEKLVAEFLFWVPVQANLTVADQTGTLAVRLRGSSSIPNVPVFTTNPLAAGIAVVAQVCVPRTRKGGQLTGD